MSVITIDYETFWTQDYSLTKLSEVDYILDSRFQTILCAVKDGRAPAEIFVGHDAVAQRLAQINWSSHAVLAHNTRFDASILAWHYDHTPKLYLDTLSMARAVTHWNIGSSSLKAISDYLKLPPKGTGAMDARGKRLEDFTPSELDAYAEYCRRDCTNCYEIFERLGPLFSKTELRLMDLFLRMFIAPQVTLDPELLTMYLAELRANKQTVLDRVGHIDPKTFSSNPRFANLLTDLGVELPMKVSPTTGQQIPALAKNDRGFRELCEDDTQPLEVQAVLAARMGVKSTIEETRAEKFLSFAHRNWPASRGTGWAPVAIKHYGARTGRPSGDSGLNWLNLKRGSPVRDAIRAPAGQRIVHRDSSQIEARMVAWLAGCESLVKAFAKGRDVYCDFGEKIFGRIITREDKLERFISKTALLGLGYSCGWEKFRHMLFIGSGGLSYKASEIEAKRIVYDLYRIAYPEIPELWRACERLLCQIVEKSGRADTHTLYLALEYNIIADDKLHLVVAPGFDALHLPNGMAISYPDIERKYDPARDGYETSYRDPYGGRVKIYGGKVCENASQALARIVVTDIAVRAYELTGVHPFLTTYDSLDFSVPLEDVEWWDRYLEKEFARVPAWAPDLPLASEGGWGVSLADAEKGRNQ